MDGSFRLAWEAGPITTDTAARTPADTPILNGL